MSTTIGIIGIVVCIYLIVLLFSYRIRGLKKELCEMDKERLRLEHLCSEYRALENIRQTISDVLSERSVRQRGARTFTLRQRTKAWGYVYMMSINDEYHKIGYSNNVKSRLGEMQVSSPYPIRVVHVIASYHAPRLEVLIQNRYAERWVCGEWFKLTADDIAEFSAISSPVTSAELDRLEEGQGGSPYLQIERI